MASLRKDSRGKSPFWYGCITVPGKGQTQRSTGVVAAERNRGEAMAIAERWEREAKQLGPAVHLKNRDAVLEAFVDATQKAVAGELTEATARGVLDRILESTGQNPIHTESVRDFCERWLNANRSELANTSHVAYKSAVRLFLDHLGNSADKPLRAVQTRQIESFKASRIVGKNRRPGPEGGPFDLPSRREAGASEPQHLYPASSDTSYAVIELAWKRSDSALLRSFKLLLKRGRTTPPGSNTTIEPTGGRGKETEQLWQLGVTRLLRHIGNAEQVVEFLQSRFTKPHYTDAVSVRTAARRANANLNKMARAGRFKTIGDLT